MSTLLPTMCTVKLLLNKLPNLQQPRSLCCKLPWTRAKMKRPESNCGFTAVASLPAATSGSIIELHIIISQQHLFWVFRKLVVVRLFCRSLSKNRQSDEGDLFSNVCCCHKVVWLVACLRTIFDSWEGSFRSVSVSSCCITLMCQNQTENSFIVVYFLPNWDYWHEYLKSRSTF